jgi:hypothetical protein
MEDLDVCQYHVKWGNETMIVTCVGIDSAICGVSCNVDFVHFVWEDNDMLGFRRHALTFLPDPRTGHGDVLPENGRLLCLRQYTVASMGWVFVSRCESCMVRFRENLRPYTGCVATAAPCNCNVRRRQPLTLRDMASHTVFTLSLNADLFELTNELTYSG